MSHTVSSLIRDFENNTHQTLLQDLYQDPAQTDCQRERYIRLLQHFRDTWGDLGVHLFSAPGRSEVGGNHTDHQHGCVLATSINLDVAAVAAPVEEPEICIHSQGYRSFSIRLDRLTPQEKETGSSRALVRGVASRLSQLGWRIGGFHACLTSDVLSGSGLSSSAAFEVLIGTILSGLYNDGEIDAVTIAQASQYAENIFFGKPCGLMDQMACAYGGLIAIDFADPENPLITPVKTDFSAYRHSLCITDTKGSHADLTPDYAAIPAEMKSVAACFGKDVLRQVDEKEFIQDIPEIRQKTGDRAIVRALHFFAENKRPAMEQAALESGDFAAFLRLIRQSGASSFQYLQNVYSPHQPQIQGVSLGIALSEAVLKDRGAVRVHGGGFAGTIQAFVPDDMVEEYRSALDHLFGKGSCHVLKVRSRGGVMVL